ncbi:MAG: sulfite exporter TauE/SafE family protein [Porticoccaceae bacterium]|nr:sulfite exporter TauE/SafE family protein [Porticoccaceae bacterium]
MITDPLFYLCAIPAVLLFGMSKGGLGGGLAMLSVPLLALVISPLQGAAILLPILVVMDVVAVWIFRHHWSRANIRTSVPGAVAGIIAGGLFFPFLSDDGLKILVGLLSVVFGADYWLRKAPAKAAGVSAVKGNFWGMVSGFSSFSIHAGGTPISVYYLPQRMDKRELMGTFAIFFAIVNALKLVPYALLGQFSTENLATALVLTPVAPLGVMIGFKVLNKISNTLVYQLSYGFLVVVGVKLLWEGLA